MARPKSSINMNASKETDDIEEDSLNLSISEHISEEIESNNNLSIDDSLADDNNERTFDKLLITDKKRKLFDIDSDEEGGNGDASTVASTDGGHQSSRFSNFEINNDNLDTLLSGDNIAQHFKADLDFNDQQENRNVPKSDDEIETQNESKESKNSFNPKLDEKNMNDGAISATAKILKNDSNSKSDEHETSKIDENVNERVHDVNSSKQSELQDDVILINDHEISITSLKNLQSQPIEQNTASDISEILNEDNVLSMKGNSESGSGNLSENRSKLEDDSNMSGHNKSDISSGQKELSKSGSQSAKVVSRNQSVSENEELSFNQGGDNLLSKKSEMREIINEAIDKMPIDSNTNKPEVSPNTLSTESRKEVGHTSTDEPINRTLSDNECNSQSNQVAIGQQIEIPSSEIIDPQMKVVSDSGAVTKTQFDPIFEKELHINLAHIQSKIQELHELTAGKQNLTVLNFPLESDSRRDSLKDLPQSGRESSSIITNCTEYKTFQEDYFKLTDLQIAIIERDKIIEQLTDSLKQSITIREQLHEQGERLTREISQLRKQYADTVDNINDSVIRRANWLSGSNVVESTGQRLSEITIDLVSESEYDDDEEGNNEFYEKKSPIVELVDEDEKPIDEIKVTSAETHLPEKLIEEFKAKLTAEELTIFSKVEGAFDKLLNQKLELTVKNYEHEMQVERNEKDAEIIRLRQLLSNIKTGSTEVKELRQELGAIHKKEMEDLRLYFERKCTDLEKQYSEEINSQHSRRHSNDTNSDLSECEIFPDDANVPSGGFGSVRRSSKAGEILASPTHRKLTPTNLGPSSPNRRNSKKSQSESSSTSSHKQQKLAIDELHSFYKKKIAEINKKHENALKTLNYKYDQFENRQTDDEYMLTQSSSDQLTKDKNKFLCENNEMNFNKLVEEYDRRLDEQVKLAKLDMLNELETQIKTLLSDTTPEESRWPPELILLREKFTARSQLEVAQLQIKHEEEMSRVKTEFQKQLNRKQQRQQNFDDGRDFAKCYLERDNLRELCHTFRHLLYELAKCVSVCENDLNATLIEELNKYGILQGVDPVLSSRPTSPIDNNRSNLNETGEVNLNQSTTSSINNNVSMRVAVIPDVSGILSLIEDPQLVSFVAERFSEQDDEDEVGSDTKSFDLNECLAKLKSEADSLLQLSEKLKQRKFIDNKELDKNESIEEEDGLKSKVLNLSLNSYQLAKDFENVNQKQRLSLPIILPINNSSVLNEPNNYRMLGANSELNIQLNELKNRLVMSELKRQELEKELADAVSHQNQLTEALRIANMKLNNVLDGRSESLSEGYGISQLKSPQRQPTNPAVTSFSELQDRAKQFFNDTTNNSSENLTQLLQLIEDFCREGDKLIEEEKQVKKDLQEQILAADKQRKQDLKFLDEQAAERELERDEFTKEIEQLKSQLREKDKERHTYERIAKESESLEQQLKEMSSVIESYKINNVKLQTELKASIDKIYDLREIICELETQIKSKNSNQDALLERLRALEVYMNDQTTANDSLQHEVESLKTEITPAYKEKIKHLEEQLQSLQSTAEQNVIIERIAANLREIEDNLDRKTQVLESIYVSTGSLTTCSSPSEDVSIKGSTNNLDGTVISPRNFKYLIKDPSFPIDQIQRIMEKLLKHTKAEESAVKRIRELDMQYKTLHTSYVELQSERDLLQEKMSEQILRISTIQSRLDEQRQRAEELQRAGTSDLNLKVYDLQTEVASLKETLTAREKQITVLKNHLTQSKEIIDKQEAEIAMSAANNGGGDTGQDVDRSMLDKLQAEVKAKDVENKRLKEQIRTEMIKKAALPDLMETMLADKSEEIDFLKEQLESREKELKSLQFSIFSDKPMVRTVSEIGSSLNDFEHNDYIRKMADNGNSSISIGMDSAKIFANIETSKENIAELIDDKIPSLKLLPDYTSHPEYDLSISPKPRQIQFNSKSTVESTQTPQSQSRPNSSKNENKVQCDQNLQSLESEIANLKSLLEQKAELVEKISRENLDLKNSLDTQKANLDKLLAERDRLSGEIEELRESKEKLLELESELKSKEEKLNKSEAKYEQKCNDFNILTEKFNEQLANTGVHKQQIDSLNNVIALKDEMLSKLEKDIFNYAQNETKHLQEINKLQTEVRDLQTKNEATSGSRSEEFKKLQEERDHLKEILADTERELAEKMIAYEKCLLDIEDHEKTIYHLNDVLTDSKSARSVEEMRIQMRQQDDRNQELLEEIEQLRYRLNRIDHSSSPKPFSLDEIQSRVEKELNYSAQLDSNILKAIESDEINSDNENFDDNEKERLRTEQTSLKQELRTLEKSHDKLQEMLDSERKKFASIREQDATCIESMTNRLEAALEHESGLNKLLDEERYKYAQLATKLSDIQSQQMKLSTSNLSLTGSPAASPRRNQKGTELESELVKRLNDEIKLLKSQNDREKERGLDIEKALLREKSRFEKELSDQKSYSDSINKELDRIIRENQVLQNDLDHSQDRLSSAEREIENLQIRIKNLQEADTYRAARQEKERNEHSQSALTIQDLRNKLVAAERERDVLQDRVNILQNDIERGAQREARLTETLAGVAGLSLQSQNQANNAMVPQQLLTKLKEMNDKLSDNVRENRQLSNTLQFLTDERKLLQTKVLELEQGSIDQNELEERANHLFGKYLRTESFRRALIHQKRYLMIVLSTYECNEAKVLSLVNNNQILPKRKKRPSFKSVALLAIAIERMKFILRRWHTGKRVCAKGIFTHNTPPRRTLSGSTINWARHDHQPVPNTVYLPQSPPSRDRPNILKGRRTNVILNENNPI